MIKTFCDRCEKEIDDECKRGETESIWHVKDKKILSLPKIILCQLCFTALESFLNNK